MGRQNAGSAKAVNRAVHHRSHVSVMSLLADSSSGGGNSILLNRLNSSNYSTLGVKESGANWDDGY